MQGSQHMSPTRRGRANQSSKRRPSRKSSQNARPEAHATSGRLAKIDDDIGSALSLAFAIELMGFGQEKLGDDYSKALIAVTQSLIGHLNAAKAACRSVRGEKHPALGSSTTEVNA